MKTIIKNIYPATRYTEIWALLPYYAAYSADSGPGVVLSLRHCATSRRVPGSIPGIFSGASDSSMCPGVDSASKNEYQDIPGGKDGRFVG